jgi:hypothetical protein
MLVTLYNRLRTTVLQGNWQAVSDDLAAAWAANYRATTGGSELVEVSEGPATFLFDIEEERLVAAWAVSAGKHLGERDKSRMSGHPLGAEEGYHRGHAIAHTLGGGTDINLVPQLGKLNIGPFRDLERNAVAMPGSFYFTHWRYSDGGERVQGKLDQKPAGVDQGLLVRGRTAIIHSFTN